MQEEDMFANGFHHTDSAVKSSNGTHRNGNGHLIELRKVQKVYSTAAGPFNALKDINLQVDRGEFVAVIGKSGSGKSTLINMITGIDRPTTGQVFIGDTAIHALKEGQLAPWRGRTVGIIFQFFQLLPTLSVIENVMLPMDFCRLYTMRERKQRAMHLLAQVEMTEQASKLPAALSGGQQQRVAIARALATDPPILVADEPTGNLDSKTAASVFRLFETLVAGGKTILMVTHDQDLAKRATRTVIISDGQIIEEYLAHVFPALDEDQLVEATRDIELQKFLPGTVIVQEGRPPDSFYLVTRGEVEVVLPTGDDREVVVTRLHSGQYFGEVELLRGGANIATIRAAPETGVEVGVLDCGEFERLMSGSAPTRAQIDQIVQQRVLENTAGRRR
jgi:ABC-type lipoprotein export system ATPase subunit